MTDISPERIEALAAAAVELAEAEDPGDPAELLVGCSNALRALSTEVARLKQQLAYAEEDRMELVETLGCRPMYWNGSHQAYIGFHPWAWTNVTAKRFATREEAVAWCNEQNKRFEIENDIPDEIARLKSDNAAKDAVIVRMREALDVAENALQEVDCSDMPEKEPDCPICLAMIKCREALALTPAALADCVVVEKQTIRAWADMLDANSSDPVRSRVVAGDLRTMLEASRG